MFTILLTLMLLSLVAVSFRPIVSYQAVPRFFRLIPWKMLYKYIRFQFMVHRRIHYALALFAVFLSAGLAGPVAFGTTEVTLSPEVKKAIDDLAENQKKAFEQINKKQEEIEKAQKDNKAVADLKAEQEKRITAFGTLLDESKAKIEKLQADQTKRMDEFEAKVQTGGFGGRKVKTIGEMVVEAEAYKNRKSQGGKALISMKSFFKDNLTTDSASGGAAIVPFRVPGIIQPTPEQELRIRDLLNVTPISVGSLEYVREDSFTDASSGNANRGGATVVAEAGTKPESAITFSLQTATAKVIATTLPITEQIEDDAPVLIGYVNGRLLYTVKIEEEDEILYGDGTGAHLEGITTLAAEYNRRVAGDTFVDTLRRMQTQVRLAHFPATGYVMDPADWESIELLKETTDAYLFASPQDRTAPRIWGLPVVESESITNGDVLCGAFGLGATLYDRQQANIQVGWVNAQFAQNMKTIRAEERIMLVTFRPNAFVYGTLASSS